MIEYDNESREWMTVANVYATVIDLSIDLSILGQGAFFSNWWSVVLYFE